MTDEPNRVLCTAFRDLLTGGFFAVVDGEVMTGESAKEHLESTKAWRGALWKQFKELEDRLCPVQAHDRMRKSETRDRR